jgi:two-component system alkaline phosphatase synthesis response regulator PhoP
MNDENSGKPCDSKQTVKSLEGSPVRIAYNIPVPKKILLVDDEPEILEICRDYLKASGYEVVTARDGRQGLASTRREKPDLVVLDLMLPEMDGLDVCRTIRRESNVPIIMLTARVEEAEKLIGLEIGADDYMTKPFSPRELVARVRVVLRRASGDSTAEVIRVGNISLDRAHYEVQIEKRVVPLTPTEFEIMATLMSQPGRIFSRNQLLMAAHGVAFESYERAIDSHIRNLRHKLEPEELIITVYGVGYKFHAPEGHRFGTV